MAEMRLYAFACGTITMDRTYLAPGLGDGQMIVAPMPFFLVVHPKGNVLVDTGPHRDVITDAEARWGSRFLKLATPIMQPGDDVVTQLASIGYRPDDIAIVVNSHFHNDHAGGNQFFPYATFLVQRAEMDAWRDPGLRQRMNYYPADVDHPLRYQEIEGDHDVHGDGTITLFPTFGHSPGHQSVLLRLPKSGPIILTGDGCYLRDNLEQLIVPKIGWDREVMGRSIAKLREIRDRELALVIYGHDADSWAQLKHAPDFYE